MRLMKSAAGDSVVLQLPGSTEDVTVLKVDVTSALLSNRSVNHQDPSPLQRGSLAAAKCTP
jgi:hypothetical protein